MVIAGEPSGDLLAAELVRALAATPAGAGAKFIGAGGPRMAEAGVELAFDMTQHAVVGLWEVLKNYLKFRRLFKQLLDLAVERRPDAVICVDFSGFNRRFAAALRERQKAIPDWKLRVVQYVSPQVWASRPGRVRTMERDLDLLLSIFPFEKPWYAEHAPKLRVEFVGHPMMERFQKAEGGGQKAEVAGATPVVLLLPGSREAELRRHLPVMREALVKIRERMPVRVRMVLPGERLRSTAAEILGAAPDIEMQIGGLANALAQATVAMASTGTVTMECACFGVPTVTLYKTSWLTYEIGRRIVRVTSLTMPNLLAGEAVFPEFIQDEATGENLARAALELLEQPARRESMRGQLRKVIETLGPPGAAQRAAEAVAGLLASSR